MKAIAYFLGGATLKDEVLDGFVRALGYSTVNPICEAVAKILQTGQPTVVSALASDAQRRLLRQFGYKVERLTPAAEQDALHEIIHKLPADWIASIEADTAENRAESWEWAEIWSMLESK